MRLEQILGTQFPLIQGGMANIATGAFAAEIANAGALGLIGGGGMTAEQLRAEIRDCKAKTDHPFGVNIMLMNPEAGAMAAVVVEEGVKFVTTGAGNPGQYLPAWLAAGIGVFPVVSSVALAKRLAQHGATGIIAEGCECGGHIGETTTMALVPQVVAAVDIPVIAAGGIASGAQLAAAYALGAVGAQLGTCLLASEECPIHQNYKLAVCKAGDRDTIVTGRRNGAPVRVLKNQMAKEYLRRENEGATLEELEHYTLGSLRRAVRDGDVKTGSLMAGQVAGQVTRIRPAREILAEISADADAVIARLSAKWGGQCDAARQ